MKKITQNLTNVKTWQSIVFAFMFLFSLTINSQTVGEEFLANPGVTLLLLILTELMVEGISLPTLVVGELELEVLTLQPVMQMEIVFLQTECLSFLKLVVLMDNLSIKL
jgi:hypothetical protein